MDGPRPNGFEPDGESSIGMPEGEVLRTVTARLFPCKSTTYAWKGRKENPGEKKKEVKETLTSLKAVTPID